ncbi:N-acetylmuramoyl-L-alanine amidase [Parablautia intestinalis]|nr:N-acetylmuramoyl-L-alanine amidase [Parablautia intestinalis]MCI8616172.1 N-acetylmuramoyl-L-alanine amidase [Lachnospiraceae bacterium]MDE7047502.1 N-acetylmuramoyl-L-alanine amidase [Lachnospiraceae bacterium]
MIVIVPGHGGENEGTKYDGYVEKEMTMARCQGHEGGTGKV